MGPNEQKRRILMAEEAGRKAVLRVDTEKLWIVVIAVGLGLADVGWTDLALLWLVPHFGSPEWEFGTISSHFDGLALGTLGLAAVALACLALGLRRTVRALAAVCGLVALVNVAAYALYLLDVPVTLRGVAAELKPTLVKVILKATIFALVYIALYTWLGVFLWRRTRVAKAPVASSQ
jgi:hypothetical protein